MNDGIFLCQTEKYCPSGTKPRDLLGLSQDLPPCDGADCQRSVARGMHATASGGGEGTSARSGQLYTSICCDKEIELAWDETRLEDPCKFEYCLKLTGCDDGQYLNGRTLSCATCPKGFECKAGKEPALCPSGHYCASGKAVLCKDGIKFCAGPGFYKEGDLPLIDGKYRSTCATRRIEVEIAGFADIYGIMDSIRCRRSIVCNNKGYALRAPAMPNGPAWCTCSKGYFLDNEYGTCKLCPDGFYCTGQEEPELCDRNFYCEKGEKHSCDDCSDKGMMKRPSSPKPFYTSVCHTFENGAIKTEGPSLKWLRPACQKKRTLC